MFFFYLLSKSMENFVNWQRLEEVLHKTTKIKYIKHLTFKSINCCWLGNVSIYKTNQPTNTLFMNDTGISNYKFWKYVLTLSNLSTSQIKSFCYDERTQQSSYIFLVHKAYSAKDITKYKPFCNSRLPKECNFPWWRCG